MRFFYFDTETCGKYGFPVILQHAWDDGPVEITHLWLTPIGEIKGLIESLFEPDVCVVAHNINFDWQVLTKLYSVCHGLTARHADPSTTLQQAGVDTVAELEHGHLCLKPHKAVDTMLLAAKSREQSSVTQMKPIRIRRVPVEYGEALAAELTRMTDLPEIMFARKSDKRPVWKVAERKGDSLFVDVSLSFAPSNGLKQLSRHLLGFEPTSFSDIAPASWPVEDGFAPFIREVASPLNGWAYTNSKSETGWAWPALIGDHIEFWQRSRPALKYAEEDITMLRGLHRHFGKPENDEDSILACSIASCRLRGFRIDHEKIEHELEIAKSIVQSAAINVNSPKQVRDYISEALDPMERIIVAHSSNAKVLENIVKAFTLEEEEDCECEDPKLCKRCCGTGKVGPGPMPVVERVKHVELVRQAKKRVELLSKLRKVKRAYANFRAVGTKSGRLSGTDGLNFQGIERYQGVRECFIFADEGYELSGGDMNSQELAIAATTMSDKDLLNDMLQGKSLHGIFGSSLYDISYEEIMTAGKIDGRYETAKSCVYAMLYGAMAATIAMNAGVSMEVAQSAFDRFEAIYKGVGVNRRNLKERFSTLVGGSEGKLEFTPKRGLFVESIFGFRRYFDTEYLLQEMLYEFLNRFPESWRNDPRQIVRDRKKERVQTMAGAIRSAIYGACFSIQNGVIRAATNHQIQSAGRTITVDLQLAIWKHQPVGIHKFHVYLMSVHDEIPTVHLPALRSAIDGTVCEEMAAKCKVVPLLSIDWGHGLKGWWDLKKAKPETHSMVRAGNPDM